MRKFILITVLAVCLSGTGVGQELSGQLNGVIEPGLYHVVNDISVTQWDSLVIEPGTTLLFDGDFNFTIFGYIYAVGTEEDSIIFKPSPGAEPWNGVNCNPSTNDNSVFEYCVIEGSDMQGFEAWACSPTLSHCTIIDNWCQDC